MVHKQVYMVQKNTLLRFCFSVYVDIAPDNNAVVGSNDLHLL